MLGLHLGGPPGQPPHVLRTGSVQSGQLPLVSAGLAPPPHLPLSLKVWGEKLKEGQSFGEGNLGAVRQPCMAGGDRQ